MDETNFNDAGILKRMSILFRGLGRPCSSREYKLARIELQRLTAPLVAVTTVSLAVIVLVVVTAIQSQGRETIPVYIAPIDDPPTPEPTPVEPPEPPEPQPVDPNIEITVDLPTPVAVPMIDLVDASNQAPSNERSVKPADVDAVAAVKSVVKMKNIRSGPTTGTIGTNTNGRPTVGSTETEHAVMKVLWWLKAHQNTDGSWGSANKVANTAFATLTYLAHGEYPGARSPNVRDFGPVVQAALGYLLGQLTTDAAGVPHFAATDGNEYSFLIAAYALCEAYGMTKNPAVKDAAEQCLYRIVENQSPTGGWDYKLNKTSTRDDLSFAGWAIQALKAGKMAGLHPAGLQEAINKAIGCLKKRSYSKSAGFTYTPTGGNNGGNPGLAGVGTLAMQFLGHGEEDEARNALEVMRDWKPSFDATGISAANVGACPQYYCYYATQCKYQAGMKPGARKEDEKTWVEWNAAMRKLYPGAIKDLDEKVQDVAGHEHAQGYYENLDQHTSRPYMDTCLVALQLMVYYRYLPTTSVAATSAESDPAPDATAFAANDVKVSVNF